MINLSNLNIILTGSTGIIGNSILENIHKAKANIIATGTNQDKLKIIKDNYPSVITKQFDILEHSSIEKFIEVCNDEFNNKIDVLINNAGITNDNLAIRMKDEEWNKVINLNLTSSFLLSKYSIKKMIRNKNGKIINITSIVGHTGNIGQTNYAASKAGLIGMSKSLALEYGKKNIKINCVSPGFIKSEMTDKIADNFRKTLEDKIKLVPIPDNDIENLNLNGNIAITAGASAPDHLVYEIIDKINPINLEQFRLKEEDEYFPLPQQLRSNIKNISDFLNILNTSDTNPKSEYGINNDKKWTATEALNSL